jgi:hypothetical protein
MTYKELKQLALECLAKSFRGEVIPSHVVQAAVSIVLTPELDVK